MNEINITNAVYSTDNIDGSQNGIIATIDGVEVGVPLCEGNRHYDEIMRQVDAGTLTIEDAD